MRSFTKILASSVTFNAASAPFRTAAVSTTAQFATQGALGGPLIVQFGTGIAMQACLGGAGATTGFGGTFNLLGSNVLEAAQFSVIGTSTVSSTATVLLRDSSPWYKYVDFSFVPAVAGSSGFLTVILNEKGNG